ncbi:MAG TPA: leucine-rich repeat protein [Candidatus Saccharibacteria bacterium]|nr:leucine-rich repeat protein [Candidatus Saccharibacteria bacterium]
MSLTVKSSHLKGIIIAFIGVLFIFAMAVAVLSRGALVSADPPGPPTDEIYFTFNSETGTITDYDDEGPATVIIPSTIGGVTVTTIATDAFNGNGITSVYVPETVELIQPGGFSGNTLLESIMFGPDEYAGPAVLDMPDGAFNGMDNLTTVIDNGTVISYGAAFSSPELTTLDLTHSQATTFSNGAFSETKLTSVFIPNSATLIENSSFNNNELLTEVTFGTEDYAGAPVLEVTNGSFFYYDETPTVLSSIVDNGTLKGAYYGSFEGLTSLSTLDFTNSQLETIVDSFDKIGLATVQLPNSLTTLNDAFAGSTTLTTIIFGTEDYEGEPQLALTSGFNGFPVLETIVDNGIISTYDAVFIDVPGLDTFDITRSQATSFVNGAFSDTGLTTITIPNSAEVISGGVFAYNESLTEVILGTPDYLGPAKLAISDGSFSADLLSLTSVVDNGLVQSITAGSFNAPTITSIDFTNSQIEVISGGAFYNTKIESLFVPNSVTAIEYGAFNDSTLLSEITFGTPDYFGPAVLDIIGALTFEMESPVTESLTVVDNGTIKSVTAAFNSLGVLSELDLTKSQIQTIESSFSDNVIESLTFPDTLEQLNADSFIDSTQLEKVVFGTPEYDGEATLGIASSANVFGNVSTIQEVVLNPVVLSVGDGVFQDNQITKITVGSDVDLTDAAFSGNVANTGEFIQLYTVDPTNPHNFTNYVSESEGSIVFAYIVNPAVVTVEYEDEDGDELQTTISGVGDGLSDYTVAANPTADLAAYYQAQTPYTTTVPSITGYDSPAAITRQLKQANHPDNTFTLVYTVPQEEEEEAPGNNNGGNNGGGGTGNNNAPAPGAGTGGGSNNTTPDTGDNEDDEDTGEDRNNDESSEQPVINGTPKVEKTEDGRYTITVDVENATSVELYDGTTLLDRQVIENSDGLQTVTLNFTADDDSERKLIIRVNNALLGAFHEQTVTVGTPAGDSAAEGSIPGWVWIITGVGAGGIILTWSGVAIFRGRGV